VFSTKTADGGGFTYESTKILLDSNKGSEGVSPTDRPARRFCIKYYMNVESFFYLAAFGPLKFPSSDLAGFEFFYL
jgi:hypothetical protein